MGSGTYASLCRKYFPDADISGAEIDGQIIELAGEHFGLPDDVPVAEYDGRAYLSVNKRKYDVIMVDAYQDITIPFQMSTVEFFTMVKSHLKENGVMVVNLNMHSGDEGSINEYLSDTIASVFENVRTANVKASSNKVLFASSGETVPISEAVNKICDSELAAKLCDVDSRLTDYTGGDHILTDDKAPVELLGMKVIDGMITEELGYYKNIYREGGIRALIDSLS